MNANTAIHARNSNSGESEISLSSLVALVTWLGCVGVGIAGLLIPYPRPTVPTAPPAPVVAQMVHVDLTNDPSPPPNIAPPFSSNESVSQPPILPLTVAAPAAPALARTIEPSQPIPTRTEFAAKQVATTNPSTRPQRLIYGQGEGRQPAPDYPREAAMAHQQGNVVVRFVVGEDGRVQSGQAVTPSPYPLLNQAAVRAVRETWRFRTGSVRNYEVTIVFQLR